MLYFCYINATFCNTRLIFEESSHSDTPGSNHRVFGLQARCVLIIKLEKNAIIVIVLVVVIVVVIVVTIKTIMCFDK